MLYEALKAHKVPAEYLELPSGGHGLNGYKGPMWDAWQTKSLEWLGAAEAAALPVLERTSAARSSVRDLATEQAELRLPQATKPFWQGPLCLPSWLKGPAGDRQTHQGQGRRHYPGTDDYHTKAKRKRGSLAYASPWCGGGLRGDAALSGEGMGHGFLRWEAARRESSSGISEAREWGRQAAGVGGMYFGWRLHAEEQVMVPTLRRPFWPRSQADGYCVPSAGLSHPEFLPLLGFWPCEHPPGEFGPAMGTPYAAAYPRPLFSAAMGSDEGWVAMGPGTVPDAALTLQIRSSTAALEWLYREDLWPAPAQGSRVWSEPLRLFWAPVAWEAYARLFDSFGPFPAGHAIHQKGHWNSWGNFKRGQMDLRDLADRVAGDFHLPILVLDEGWETSPSSGIPNRRNTSRISRKTCSTSGRRA